MKIEDRVRERLAKLCVRLRVDRLELFGSAARHADHPGDLDFIVSFQSMNPAEHAEAYFALKADLETLFGLPVDLVELEPIRNPYFLQAIETDRTLVYAA